MGLAAFPIIKASKSFDEAWEWIKYSLSELSKEQVGADRRWHADARFDSHSPHS